MEARTLQARMALSMSGYSFQPLTVAATLLFRSANGTSAASSEQICQVGEGDSPLFKLVVPGGSSAPGQPITLSSPFGQATLERAHLKAAEPDPLWEVADSICSHMEDDHGDTFATFLGALGRAEDQATAMPWVESQGFFLTTSGGYVFLPFPTPCLDANSVRATLIKMLRRARGQL